MKDDLKIHPSYFLADSITTFMFALFTLVH